MLKRLKIVLREVFVEQEVVDAHALPMACALLMFEILRADHHADEAELHKISQHIKTAFDFDDEETGMLMQQARQQSDHIVSLHEVVRTINEAYTAEDKKRLLKMLWDVAYADGELDRNEEYVLRKLADLLYVPHRDFIQTKHAAMPE